MKIFVIEAYGGKHTDGPVCHFTVHADTLEEALEFVRETPRARLLDRLDIVEETPEFESGAPGIISEQEGAYLKPL